MISLSKDRGGNREPEEGQENSRRGKWMHEWTVCPLDSSCTFISENTGVEQPASQRSLCIWKWTHMHMMYGTETTHKSLHSKEYSAGIFFTIHSSLQRCVLISFRTLLHFFYTQTYNQAKSWNTRIECDGKRHKAAHTASVSLMWTPFKQSGFFPLKTKDSRVFSI